VEKKKIGALGSTTEKGWVFSMKKNPIEKHVLKKNVKDSVKGVRQPKKKKQLAAMSPMEQLKP